MCFLLFICAFFPTFATKPNKADYETKTRNATIRCRLFPDNRSESATPSIVPVGHGAPTWKTYSCLGKG